MKKKIRSAGEDTMKESKALVLLTMSEERIKPQMVFFQYIFTLTSNKFQINMVSVSIGKDVTYAKNILTFKSHDTSKFNYM